MFAQVRTCHKQFAQYTFLCVLEGEVRDVFVIRSRAVVRALTALKQTEGGACCVLPSSDRMKTVFALNFGLIDFFSPSNQFLQRRVSKNLIVHYYAVTQFSV